MTRQTPKEEITAESFPTPHRGLKTNDQAEQKVARRFADRQVEMATAVRDRLHERGWRTGSPDDRLAVLTYAIEWMTMARFALGHTHPIERRPFHPGKVWLPITDADPNRDRIGEIDRLLDDGEPTMAWEIMREIGLLARWRFGTEAPDDDVLQNRLSVTPRVTVRGNRLLRGDAAQQAARELEQRVADRPESRRKGRGKPFDANGELLYVETAYEADRKLIFRDALMRLAAGDDGSGLSWARAVYRLYQAPQFKRGTDAVIRPFAVGVGAVLLGVAPRLVHDVDLRAMVMREDQFLTHLMAQNGFTS